MTKNILIPFNQNLNISARLTTINKKKNLFILIHGLTTSKDHPPIPEFEKLIQKCGYNTLAIDLFGHGESGGKFQDVTLTNGIKSIESVVKFVYDKGYKEVSILAISFAGFCAIPAISKYSTIKNLVLESPVSDYQEVEDRRRTPKILKEWKEKGHIEFTNGFGETKRLGYPFYQDIFKHNAYKAARKIKAKTLILHGKKDETVPFKQSQKLNKTIDGSKLILYSEAQHKIELSSHKKQMLEDIIFFLSK